MEKLELRGSRLSAIWWAWGWRALLVGGVGGVVAGFLIGAVLGFAGAVSGQNLTETIQLVSSLAGLVIGMVSTLWALRVSLRKSYGGYELAWRPAGGA